jgi:hypothetical protein
VYNPVEKEIYFIDSNNFDNSTSISLRLKIPKKKFTTVRMAKQYTIL